MHKLILLITALVFASNLSYATHVSKPKDLLLCSSCHGDSGKSVNIEWPNINAQHKEYLIKQMLDFKSKHRDSIVMTNIAMPINNKDIIEISQYYAAQNRSIGSTPTKYIKKGQLLYRYGIPKKNIAACMACHGPQGLGNAEANFPVLSGQNPLYTIQQLKNFRDGTRHNDYNNIMQDIAHNMSDDDINAISYYIYGLH